MQKYFVALLVILASSFGCINLHAEDFIPRVTTMAGGSDRPVADSSLAARSETTPAGSLMSEPAADSPDSASRARGASMHRQVGVDGSSRNVDDSAGSSAAAASPATTAPANSPDTSAPTADANAGISAAARKHRNAMRWQSLLPGMMK